MNINELSNFEWLSQFSGTGEESWHQDKVIRSFDIEDFRFYKDKKNWCEDYINPADIVGIDYGFAYNFNKEITWIELLNSLIRFGKIRKNKTTIDLLTEHALTDYGSSETRCVEKYGDKYITVSGQHRLALCKFLGIKSVKVQVNEKVFDYKLYNEYLGRKSFLEYLLNENIINEECYNSSLNKDGDYVSIHVGNKYLRINNNYFNSFIDLYENLNTNRFSVSVSLLTRNLFGIFESNGNSIESENDIKKYKDFLRLIKSGQYEAY